MPRSATVSGGGLTAETVCLRRDPGQSLFVLDTGGLNHIVLDRWILRLVGW